MLTDRRRAAVLGSPVGHSLSPALHRAAYAALRLDWSYTAVDVAEAALGGLVAALDASWAGLSLTMPLKRAVLPLLDTADELVDLTGVCNTVVLDGRGRHGHNTDVHGVAAALREAGMAAPASAVVLGGGATAASAVAALIRLGAGEVEVRVRDPARAEPVVRVAARTGHRVRLGRLAGSAGGEPPGVPAGVDVVVSTLPAGAADPLAAHVVRAESGAVLLDVVYHPWPTALAVAWAGSGGRVVPGDAMLLHQAAEQVRLMTGHEPPVEAMRRGMAAERQRRLARPG